MKRRGELKLIKASQRFLLLLISILCDSDVSHACSCRGHGAFSSRRETKGSGHRGTRATGGVRRVCGAVACLQVFQAEVFGCFLGGSTLQQCYDSVAAVANRWLDMLDTQVSKPQRWDGPQLRFLGAQSREQQLRHLLCATAELKGGRRRKP